MTRFLRSSALAAIVLSAPAFALAGSPAHDDAGLSPRATATFTSTTYSEPPDGQTPGTSHDDATYAPFERAPEQKQAPRSERGEKMQLATNCTCGHQS
jgi:hypothetical protein